jgi:hypothetical protein
MKMKLFCLFFLFTTVVFTQKVKSEVNLFIDSWHQAATDADSSAYFSKMSKKAIFIGTDDTERWTREEMANWSAKYFKRESAWNIKATSREVMFMDKNKIAYFDEFLISKELGLLRGSGVLKNGKNGWKIIHYVLSFSIPNEKVKSLKEIL